MKLTAFNDIALAEEDDWDVIELHGVKHTYGDELSYIIDKEHWDSAVRSIKDLYPDLPLLSGSIVQISEASCKKIFDFMMPKMADISNNPDISDKVKYVYEILTKLTELAQNCGIILIE